MSPTHLSCSALALLLSATLAHAQTSTITGIVYDSLGHTPLRRAAVQLVMVTDSLSRPRTFSALSSADGSYTITGVPHGRFGIGFQHDALTALGLESPLRAIQIGNDTTLRVDLAIPSAAEVHALACPADSLFGQGMIAGFVSDARQLGTAVGASITLHWSALSTADKRIRIVPREATQVIDDGGTYRFCGLSTDTPLTVEIVQPGYRDILGDITIPEGGALRRDWLLADTTSNQPRVTLSGTLLHADGSRATSGDVSIGALDMQTTVENGAFTLPNVPAGTWRVEARVIGYVPTSRFVDVDVSDETRAPLRLALDQKVQLLEAVNVTASSRDAKTLSDIHARQRASFGTLFTAGGPWLGSALKVSDVFRAARGWIGGSPRGCRELGSKGKHVLVVLDGEPMMWEIGDVESLVPINDVLAVETYPDAQSVPAMWRGSNICAAVAVWTKH